MQCAVIPQVARSLPMGGRRGRRRSLTEAREVFGELESLIRRINRTNAATPVGAGVLTDALARRDVLRLRHNLVTPTA